MRLGYFALTLCLCACAIVRILVLALSPCERPGVAITSGENWRCEELLASRTPIALSHITVLDLELVPGMQSRLAEGLIANRNEIAQLAQHLDSQHLWSALTVVKGVGVKRAKRYIREFRLKAIDSSP